MKVVVFGAEGWTGRAVLANLDRHEIRATVYSPESWEQWNDIDGAWQGEDVHCGDIVDFDVVHRATEGMDAIIHLAVHFPNPSTVPVERDQKAFLVNLKGLWNCIRSVYPLMKKQQSGKIVNVSSITWLLGRPFRLDYVTSKAGIVGLTHAVAPELGAHGINVNCVVPGLVQNESTLKVYQPEHFKNYSERQVLKRSLTSEDLCGAVVFFASDDAEMITGQSLVVDGGMVFQ